MLTRLCLQFLHRARCAFPLVRHRDEEERQDGLGYQGRLELRTGSTDNLARLTVVLSHIHFLMASTLESGRRVVKFSKCLFDHAFGYDAIFNASSSTSKQKNQSY